MRDRVFVLVLVSALLGSWQSRGHQFHAAGGRALTNFEVGGEDPPCVEIATRHECTEQLRIG